MSPESRPQPPPPGDWTNGPAKWIAAVLIGAASIVGMTWSLATHFSNRRDGENPSARSPLDPAAAEPASARDDSIHSGAINPPAPQAKGDVHEPSPDDPPTASSTININTATLAELELLPGIGPSLAQRIIEHREKYGAFRSVDELDRVKGIGAKILQRVRPLVRTE
ncbi:MAG: ComEA family DNA-binding protein [Phycisphaerales bacterium]